MLINRANLDKKRGIFSKNPLIISILTAVSLFLTACGGGDGASASFASVDTTVENDSTVKNLEQNTTTDNSTTNNTNVDSGNVIYNTKTEAVANSVDVQSVYYLLNSHREQCGFGKLYQNQQLTTIAENHNRYLGYVNQQTGQPYLSHSETDISNPYYSGATIASRAKTSTLGSKATSVYYPTNVIGENLSASLLTTTRSDYVINHATTNNNMLLGLLAAPYHLKSLVSPMFNEVGLSAEQLKWNANTTYYYANYLAIVSARPTSSSIPSVHQVLSYPCQGTTNTAYELKHEEPNPFGNSRDLKTNPIGQPVYVLVPTGKVIKQATIDIKQNNVSIGYIHTLTAQNDPNKQLADNEVIFMPDMPLQPASEYTVNYTLIYTTNEMVQNSFSFTTKAKN